MRYWADIFPSIFHQYSMTSPTKSSWKSWWTPWNLHENPPNFRERWNIPMKTPMKSPWFHEISCLNPMKIHHFSKAFFDISDISPWKSIMLPYVSWWNPMKSTIFHAFFQGTMSSIALARAAKAACHFLALRQADMALVRPGPGGIRIMGITGCGPQDSVQLVYKWLN